MKTLEELKKEMDTANTAWNAYIAAFEAAYAAWCDAANAYNKKLKEEADEDT